MIDTIKLKNIDDQLQVVYQRLNDLLMTDYMPIFSEPFSITVINENTYTFLIDSLLSLLKKYNRLVDILSTYNLNPFGEIRVKKIEYTNKGSDLERLINDYGVAISDLENSMNIIDQIMKLNKITKE